ncbi:hypothetical protein CVD28_04805 [Bacillus sp. M6-12]|uniref:helix-turn-helix domain-containing protein n=1 Tax=Bacillus sp. M6-12 TaxID=2054166 RepID=UPI000C769B8B|nr:helix-turn-helix domain-containing protein [Bacillus sp. M6-12]PLS19734.1 hypothetical protein CVD28_04805 [Bacillus sp. M6-12]
MNQEPKETLYRDADILDLVLTTKEASEKYDVADCTFRTWIKDGLFRQKDIKKSGNTWLIKREAIEELLRNKNMFGKTFTVDGEKVRVEHLGYKGNTIQIWYENDHVKQILENLPNKELVPQMFEVFKEESKMNYKIVIIDNNLEESDNWFFRKEKVWALTLKGVLETIRQSMEMKQFDTSQFDSYLKELNLSI